MAKIQKIHPFQFLGQYRHIDSLINNVLDLDESEWQKFTIRQKNIVGHKFTQTVPLMFDYLKKSRDIRHPNYERFEHHLSAISEQLHEYGYSSVISRANLVRLFAQSEIAPHIDQGDFLNSTRRVHIPIITNDLCTFAVGSEIRHLPVGEMWEINNTGLTHSVTNAGSDHRVHLVVDVR